MARQPGPPPPWVQFRSFDRPPFVALSRRRPPPSDPEEGQGGRGHQARGAAHPLANQNRATFRGAGGVTRGMP